MLMNKILPAAIYILISLWSSHQLFAMEKEEKIKTDTNVVHNTTELREAEEKRLTFNLWIIKEAFRITHGDDIAQNTSKGPRYKISMREYDFVKPITFICPTIETLKSDAHKMQTMDNLEDTDFYYGYTFSDNFTLCYKTTFEDLHKVGDFVKVSYKKEFNNNPNQWVDNTIIYCYYNFTPSDYITFEGDLISANLIISDRDYSVTFDSSKFNDKNESTDYIEFTITPTPEKILEDNVKLRQLLHKAQPIKESIGPVLNLQNVEFRFPTIKELREAASQAHPYERFKFNNTEGVIFKVWYLPGGNSMQWDGGAPLITDARPDQILKDLNDESPYRIKQKSCEGFYGYRFVLKPDYSTMYINRSDVIALPITNQDLTSSEHIKFLLKPKEPVVISFKDFLAARSKGLALTQSYQL